MMCLHAGESLPPVFGFRHPLRAYATNSPRAQARLVVLALLADGQLDEREIDTLDRRGILADLGIARRRQPGEYIEQPGMRIVAIGFGGGEQAHHRGGASSGRFRAHE